MKTKRTQLYFDSNDNAFNFLETFGHKKSLLVELLIKKYIKEHPYLVYGCPSGMSKFVINQLEQEVSQTEILNIEKKEELIEPVVQKIKEKSDKEKPVKKEKKVESIPQKTESTKEVDKDIIDEDENSPLMAGMSTFLNIIE